eukprot:m.136537 g.136537  ORF g.136537 m.136537 type:complete len:659 (+) comp10730_c0_seq1:64-2040(+)
MEEEAGSIEDERRFLDFIDKGTNATEEELDDFLSSFSSLDFKIASQMEGTPLHVAVENGDLEVTKAILKKGANPFSRNKLQDTPLHIAAKEGNGDLARLILDQQADTFVQDFDGLTPMHFACRNGHLKVVETLFEYGATLNDVDKDMWTPIHYAADNGHFHVIVFLVEHGSIPNALTKDGSTPLHFACYWGRYLVAQILVCFGCDIHQLNTNGETPQSKLMEELEVEDLEYADKNGRLDIEDFFNKFEEKDTSKLHIAARFDLHFQVKKLIEEEKEDVNYLDKIGNTCLHVACKYGSIRVLDYLLKLGMNSSKLNFQGKSAEDLAKEGQHEHVLAILHGGAITESMLKDASHNVPKIQPRVLNFMTTKHERMKGSCRMKQSGITKNKLDRKELYRIRYFANVANLSKGDAEKIVTNEGEGVFVLRKSSSMSNAVVLVACFNGKACSFQFPFKNGVYTSNFNLAFQTVEELVRVCKMRKLLPGKLTHCATSRDGDVVASMRSNQGQRKYEQPISTAPQTIYSEPTEPILEEGVYAEVKDEQFETAYDAVDHHPPSPSKQKQDLPQIPSHAATTTTTTTTSTTSSSSSKPKPMNLWDDHDLATWLESKNLLFAKQAFLENGVDGGVFLSLTEDDLMDLGMNKVRCKSLLHKRDKYNNSLN